MVTRTSSATVVFRRPFILAGFEKMQPAGSYIVDSEEEQVDSLVVNAWRRVATTIRLPQPGGAIEYLPVDAQALREAQIRDGAQEEADQISRVRLERARGPLNRAAIAMLCAKKL